VNLIVQLAVIVALIIGFTLAIFGVRSSDK